MRGVGLFTFATLTGCAIAQTCVSGVHIIVARGSYEAPGEGITGKLADRVEAQIPNSDSVALSYPATIDNPLYFESQPQGVGNLTQLIGQYVDKCPQTKIVLMGYSQGAHVIGDTLVGNVFPGFPVNTPLNTTYLSSILAVLMFGDPANVVGVPIDVGNATKKGLFARPNSDQWTSRGLVDRVRSYCDFNDTFCDSGNSLAVHASYIGEYGNASLDFVLGKWRAVSGGSANLTNTSTATTTATSSSSSGGAIVTGASTTSRNGSASSTTPSTTMATTSASSTPSGTTGSGSSINVNGGLAVGLFAVIAALLV